MRRVILLTVILAASWVQADDLCPQLRFQGVGSFGMAWDGAHFWISWSGGSETVTEFDVDGTQISQFGTPGYQPWGMTYADDHLWICDPTTDKVYKVTTAGTVVSDFTAPDDTPFGLTFDGTYLWLSSGNSMMFQLDLTGTVIDSWPTIGCTDLAWDGTTIWGSKGSTGQIVRYTVDGTLLEIADVSWWPEGLTFDGSSLWNADSVIQTEMVYELTCPPPPPDPIVPDLINYQGRLDDAGGNPLDGVTVDLIFRFYDADTAGNLLLTVQQTGVQVTEGILNVLIGSGTATPGTEHTLAGVFQKNPVVWMSTEVGTDGEMVPRKRLASVGYALMAGKAADLSHIVPRATAPSNPTMGDVYVDSTDGKLKVYDGTTWQACW